MTNMPALSLVAVPGRRQVTIELATEIECRGFSGIKSPSLSDSLALCEALAFAAEHIQFGSTIAPIYFRQVADYAQTVAFVHELSGGRFFFGVSVSHEPALKQKAFTAGKPLSDSENFVSELKAVPRVGELPPITLAALRGKMIAPSERIGDRLVFANGARPHMAKSLGGRSDSVRAAVEFFIGDMIPTYIDNDVEVAKAVNCKMLSGYSMLPNYRNYWKEVGYQQEMEGAEQAIAV